MDILTIVLLLALIGFSFYQFRQKGNSPKDNSNILQQENTSLRVTLSAKEQEIIHLQEKLKEVEQSKEEQEQRWLFFLLGTSLFLYQLLLNFR